MHDDEGGPAEAASALEIEFAGRRFLLQAVGGSDSVAGQMQQGHYEAPLPLLTMAILCRSRGLFLDVGANNGLYSVLAAKARPDVEVVAFEPYPPVLEVLRSNLRINGIEDRVTITEAALSDANGTATLFLPDESHGLLETSCSLEPDFKPFHRSLDVPTLRLDDLVLSDRVALIKVDIEGHEAAFLRGAAGLLERDRPIVFAEMLPVAEPNFYAISKMMRELDYLFFRLRSCAAIHAEFITHDPLAWNYGLVPRDKMSTFIESCATHLVEVVQPMSLSW